MVLLPPSGKHSESIAYEHGAFERQASHHFKIDPCGRMVVLGLTVWMDGSWLWLQDEQFKFPNLQQYIGGGKWDNLVAMRAAPHLDS